MVVKAYTILAGRMKTDDITNYRECNGGIGTTCSAQVGFKDSTGTAIQVPTGKKLVIYAMRWIGSGGSLAPTQSFIGYADNAAGTTNWVNITDMVPYSSVNGIEYFVWLYPKWEIPAGKYLMNKCTHAGYLWNGNAWMLYAFLEDA